MFLAKNRADRTGECQLQRTADLSCVLGFLAGRHYGTEGADIEISAAHHVAGCIGLVRVFCFFHAVILIGTFNGIIENSLFFHEDVVAVSASFDHLHIVADLTFQADVTHQAFACSRVNAGEVAGIGIAVGIAVLDIEDIQEIVAIVKLAHVVVYLVIVVFLVVFLFFGFLILIGV